MAGTSWDQEVSDVDILDIIGTPASRLDDLENVYNHLGITGVDIDNTKLKDQHNPQKQAKNILNLWCNRNGEQATRGVFITAMKEVTACNKTRQHLIKKWKLTPPPEAKPDPAVREPQKGADDHDIMISYNWEAKPRMKKLYDELTKVGYKVWMDIYKMEDDMDSCMAKAVERAQVVFWCFSKKYQDSKNCKLEAQYSKKCKKNVIGLKYEDFSPSDWLGFLLGNLKYYNVQSDELLMENLPDIIKELENKGVPCHPNVA